MRPLTQPFRSFTSHSTACILGGLVLAQSVAGLSISPVTRNPSNGHDYVLLGQNTWTASETEALAWGGHLVTINDQAEQDWVFNTFASYGGQSRLLWIGLTDAGHEGRFTWISGETNTFTAWGPSEPNSIPGEDYVAIFYPGHSAGNRWNDWGNVASDPIGLPFNGVVEIAPDLLTTNLVRLGSNWRYLNNGTDQGTGWRELAFNDSTWAAGPAQLGYGESDEATLVPYGSNPANKPITTYFRHQFALPSLQATFTRLRIQWLRDDGGIVYLNGVEVYRSNMPGGAVNYRTLSSRTAQ